MPLRHILAIAACAGLLAGFELAGGGVPAAAAEITEWQVPWKKSRPRDPYVQSAERVWFVGQRDDYIAHLNPQSGEMVRIDLPEGAAPHNLIVGADGIVWYAGNRQAYIGRYDPASGEVRKIAMPDPEARDPHTLVFDGRGNIWFTLQGANRIGRLNIATEKVDLVKVPFERARPYGIISDPDGRPWIALFGTNRIATLDPLTLAFTSYQLPREESRPRRLERTSDGLIWYVDYAGGRLGRLEPETLEVKEWLTPGGEAARPYALAVDSRDRLWFVETASEPNRLVGFDPADGSFFDVSNIPSGGGTVRHMVFDAAANALWFGTDANTIGRADLE